MKIRKCENVEMWKCENAEMNKNKENIIVVENSQGLTTAKSGRNFESLEGDMTGWKC